MLMTKAPGIEPASTNMPDASRILGMQRIVSLVYAGRDVTPLWNELMQRVTADSTDAAALMDWRSSCKRSAAPKRHARS